MKLRELTPVLKHAAREWVKDKIPTRAASLSYYTIFSIAPLLLIAMAVAGAVFGPEAARGELQKQLQGLVGAAGARAVQEMLANTSARGSGVLATVIGVVVLLVGATGAFAELQDALNSIWEVPPRRSNGVWAFVRTRFLSFAMVLVVGFLLLVSLVLSTVLSAVGTFATQRFAVLAPVLQVLNVVVSLGITTVLFALIYKVLPDESVEWRDVWWGAAFTAVLFSIGRILIGLYLGRSTVASGYGAAGSFAVLLIWIYYSSILLFTGAEFTQAFAMRHGSHAKHRGGDRDGGARARGEHAPGAHAPGGGRTCYSHA